MTGKIFYADSYQREFQSKVLACSPFGDLYKISLEETAFFPEGGGQYGDRGQINGKEVLDVQEQDGIIWHMMRDPMEVGCQVQGKLDWQERFMKMQQHTGEHIVSGLVCKRYGYHNVGFHLGHVDCTMDFDGEIPRQELAELECLANEVVVSNREVQVFYPSETELLTLAYRSKKEIAGQVRLVEIPGVDLCACCAPHVKHTGEIGLIKFTDMRRYKGGVRLTMLCGFRALKDYGDRLCAGQQISEMLCVPDKEIAAGVSGLQQELADRKERTVSLERQLLTYRAREKGKEESRGYFFENDLEGELLRYYANLLLEEKTRRVCFVFSNAGQANPNQYRYVIGARGEDAGALAKELNQTFHGKGGGKSDMAQGTIVGGEEEIKVWLERRRST